MRSDDGERAMQFAAENQLTTPTRLGCIQLHQCNEIREPRHTDADTLVRGDMARLVSKAMAKLATAAAEEKDAAA